MQEIPTWKTLDGAEKTAALAAVNVAEPMSRLGADAQVSALELPFYPGGRLLRVVQALPGTAPLWYVALPSETVVLDGSVANIHHLNAKAPLLLTADTIESYIKFRLYFVDRATVRALRADARDYAWQATVRTCVPEGLFESTLIISTRGEITEIEKESRPGMGEKAPDTFSF